MHRPWAAGSRPLRRALAAAIGALLAGGAAIPVITRVVATDAGVLTPAERAAALSMGPWPLARIHDGANPASSHPAGIALGESLFYSPRLSATGLRCASCHEPWRHFADARVVAQGVAAGSRNTPSLLDVARHRHYGWDGARDQLWLQSLRPLRDAREMPASDAQVAALVRGDASLSARYAAAFGAAPGADDARVTRDIGFALAAYVETLSTPRTPFDDWRDRLAAAGETGEPPTSSAFPAAARRGLKLFVGSAGCASCHAGPTLGDDAFHLSLVHSSTAAGTLDPGHAGPLANTFRTPGLRGVSATGPWLHDGSAARLCDAVQPHAADPGSVPAPLSAAERHDLVVFLRTLSADAAANDASADGDIP